jgi:hypothetical protein
MSDISTLRNSSQPVSRRRQGSTNQFAAQFAKWSRNLELERYFLVEKPWSKHWQRWHRVPACLAATARALARSICTRSCTCRYARKLRSIAQDTRYVLTTNFSQNRAATPGARYADRRHKGPDQHSGQTRRRFQDREAGPDVKNVTRRFERMTHAGRIHRAGSMPSFINMATAPGATGTVAQHQPVPR